jgi:hypothetical protein
MEAYSVPGPPKLERLRKGTPDMRRSVITAIAMTIALSMLVGNYASASTFELDKAVISATLPKVEDKNARKALAVALLAYWQNFNSRIPRISPTEEAWLQGEFASKDWGRIQRAEETPEGSLHKLGILSDNCVKAFKEVSNLSGSAALNEAATTKELYAWLKTLHCYEKDEFILAYLYYGKLSNGKDDGAFSLGHPWYYRQALSDWVADSIIREASFNKAR